MALYIPTIQTKYIMPAAIDDRVIRGLNEAGVIDADTFQITGQGGDYVSVPELVRAANFAHQTIQSTSAASFTAVASADDKAVVLNDISANTFYKSQLRQVNEKLGQEISTTIGQRIAKRLSSQTLAGADAQIKAMSTSHSYVAGAADPSIATGTALAGMTVQNFLAARKVMKDYVDDLVACVIHPDIWNQLIKDLVTNYKYAAVQPFTEAIASGMLGTLLGIGKWIVTTLTPVGAGAASSAGDDQYSTLVFGQKQIGIAFQQEPEVEWSTTDEMNGGVGITNQDTVIYLKTTMRYLSHLRRIAWNSTANPSDANFADYTKYTDVSQDHRDVKAVRIVTTNA